MNPYNSPARALPLDTIDFVLSEAERESLAAAKLAFERGEIKQREVSPGVFVLVRN